MLNKSKGNMYGFITHTWNPIKGLCPHGCEYCYMHRFPQKPPRLDEKELKTDLGAGNKIFVGSSCDMWADDIPAEWIIKVADKCLSSVPGNKYLFQSKNPKRFLPIMRGVPFNDFVFCTTIETNRTYVQMGNVPSPHDRAWALSDIQGFRMLTIEPIIDFDVMEMLTLIRMIQPFQVNIGADSKGHKLPEPGRYKIEQLIDIISGFAKVIIKPNLERLMR